MSDVKRYEAVHLRCKAVHLRYGEGCEVEVVRASDYAALEAELAKLRAGLDGFVLVPVEPTPEMVSAAEEAHMPFGDMDIALRMAILSAPSAPATVQGDADNYRWLRKQHNNVNSDIGVYDGANILATPEGNLDLDAAIAAARQEGGKV